MTFRFGNTVFTITTGQMQALGGLLTAAYVVARAFGVIDIGGVPVV